MTVTFPFSLSPFPAVWLFSCFTWQRILIIGGADLGMYFGCLDHWSVRTSRREGTLVFRDPSFRVGQDLGVCLPQEGRVFFVKVKSIFGLPDDVLKDQMQSFS